MDVYLLALFISYLFISYLLDHGNHRIVNITKHNEEKKMRRDGLDEPAAQRVPQVSVDTPMVASCAHAVVFLSVQS